MLMIYVYISTIYHSVGGDWVLPNLYLLASISTDKVWKPLLSGTLVIVVGYINSAATQAKNVDKYQIPIA